MEAHYDKFLNMIRAVKINVPLVDVLARMPNYGKFLKELVSNKHKLEQISSAFLSDESSTMIQNKVPPKLEDPRSFLIPCTFSKSFSCNALADLDFDALLDEWSEILHSIEGTIIEEKLFAEFDEFMAMNIEEDTESETEEIPFEKITFNTDYKIKTSLKEPPLDLELKPHPGHLDYVFLKEPTFLPVIISSQLSEKNKNKLISVLKRHKQAFDWKRTDIPGICPRMPFGLCNDPANFQRCILAIFHDMIEESVEVFMDDFSVFGKSFDNCLNNLDKMLQRCKDANLVLN
ncbi:hypothetical protein Tco_0888291 [Tanacetum coccineum]